MPLKLEQPPSNDVPDVVAPLTLTDIQEFHAGLENYIDRRVAALRQLYPGVPRGVIRQTLTKGLCLCAAATAMLKQEPQ
jgi:hypothetical protein